MTEGEPLPHAPLVSVITAAYNAGPFLRETIESVLAQDYPHIEYIVLNDGSSDDTAMVAESFLPNIRLEQHQNMGEARSVNKGFKLAHGEIVGVVSADDPLLPGAITAIAGHFVSNPTLLVVYPDWIMIDGNGHVIRKVATFDYNYVDMVRLHHCFPGPGAFFRRTVAEHLGGRDDRYRYVGDLEFWFRAGLLGPFARLPRVLATYRVHPASASVASKSRTMAWEHVELVEALYDRRDIPREIVRVKGEAFSSAYYIAGWVCGTDFAGVRVRLMYWLRAIAFAPHLYAGRHRARLATMLRATAAYVSKPLRRVVGRR